LIRWVASMDLCSTRKQSILSKARIWAGCLLAVFGIGGINVAAAVPARVPVKAAGLYEVSFSALGLSTAVASQQVHVFNHGSEVAIALNDGNDGLFGPGDTLQFYGVPIQAGEPEFKYTDENIYRVKIGNLGLARIMPSWASSGGGITPISFRTTHHEEQSWFYWQQLPNGAGLDHWFWGRSLRAGNSRDFPFTLQQVVDSGQSITLRLTLQGETDALQNPDHTTRVSLNGTLLGEFTWDGQVPLTHAFTGLAASLLQEGSNTLTITEVSDPNILVDSVYVNHIEVDYDRGLAAVNDHLSFQLTGPASVTVTNFSSNQIQVFDLTEPTQPRQLTNAVIAPAGATFGVQFNTDLQGAHRYLAIAAPAIMSPTLSFQNTAPNLRSPANGADYLIITHDSLKTAVATLAQHRAAQGYRVKTVTTREIFDEFSDGIFTPQAIKDFLSYAYHNWQAPAPKFVVLMGDANLDYKDNFRAGQINLVPTYLIETVAIGETPSDNWFVTIDGNDVLPDMNVGRIPAKTPNDVRIITNKLIAYDQGMAGDWSSRILMATGDQDPRFESFAREWLNHVPASITTTLINPGNSE